MKQNIYDNETFYTGYKELRDKEAGLNEVLEIPAFRSLLPDLAGKVVLDLGCGFGKASKWYASQAAKRIVAVDISTKMIQRAKTEFSDDKIEYICTPMEEMNFAKDEFDLILSSLAFHYVKDYKALIAKISTWLKPGGCLIFSQEHPIVNAKKVSEGWFMNEAGQKLHWILDNYKEEGKREQHWFVDGVIKYHRTIETVVNTLIDNGLAIQTFLEPSATKEAEAENAILLQERRRPSFLMIRAVKVPI